MSNVPIGAREFATPFLSAAEVGDLEEGRGRAGSPEVAGRRKSRKTGKAGKVSPD
jgi:hypothetical protein